MQVELWPTDRPIPYARNARKISAAAVDKVAASIKEFGWRQPIVVDGEGVVIAGHTRLLAAKKLSLKQVPIHVATDLTSDQVRTYRLMDNRSHEEAEWDMELLGAEMFDLKGLGLDLSLTGFDEEELNAMLGIVSETGFPHLPNGDREPFQEMTFLLHDEQVEIVKRGLEEARTFGPFVDSPNENAMATRSRGCAKCFSSNVSSAKDIRVTPINAADAAALIKRLHYSGKIVQNSQLHFGAFLDGRLEGAMQFGPSLDKRKLQGLVDGTPWNGFLELNRMAFSERLPRNSESRSIAIAFRLIRKQYPHIQWIISFADATQCGDGCIYRASGFVLTSIKENSQLYRLPNGKIIHKMDFEVARPTPIQREMRARHSMGSSSVVRLMKAEGAVPVPGYQLRYVYFLDPTTRGRLTVPVLPFTEIDRAGARMYLGKRVTSDTIDTAAVHADEGGETPTVTLQKSA